MEMGQQSTKKRTSYFSFLFCVPVRLGDVAFLAVPTPIAQPKEQNKKETGTEVNDNGSILHVHHKKATTAHRASW